MMTRFLIALNVIGYLWEIKSPGSGMLSLGGRRQSSSACSTKARSIRPPCCRTGSGGAFSPAHFLHGGLLHIGVNMMSLWSLGRFIEYVDRDPGACSSIYVVSLVAAGLGVVYFSPPAAATVGASGAIFGLFGALFAIGFKLGRPGMDLVKANLGILVLNLIITFTVPSISWQAHVSGLLAGFFLTLLVFAPPRRVRPVVVDARTGAALESEYESPPQPR